MGRWHCLGNHNSQQWVGDVAAAQGGTSVQLYYKVCFMVYFSMAGGDVGEKKSRALKQWEK